MDLNGGITTSLTSFVIPALAYLEATKGMESYSKEVLAYRRGCQVLAVFGVAVMVLVPTAVVVSALA